MDKRLNDIVEAILGDIGERSDEELKRIGTFSAVPLGDEPDISISDVINSVEKINQLKSDSTVSAISAIYSSQDKSHETHVMIMSGEFADAVGIWEECIPTTLKKIVLINGLLSGFTCFLADRRLFQGG